MSIKFYGFVLLFIVANAFTQTDSSKTARQKEQIDSIKIYKTGTRLNQLMCRARIRIWDKRRHLKDSLRLVQRMDAIEIANRDSINQNKIQ